MKFSEVPIGARFTFRGKSCIKIAFTLAKHENEPGFPLIIDRDAEVEAEVQVDAHPMRFTDDQFDKAFEIFQEFGPRRRIPLPERWVEVFPTATPTDIVKLHAACSEIEMFAYEVAMRVRNNQLDKHAAIEQISQRFPHLTFARVNRTCRQAMYYARKDHGAGRQGP